MSRRDQVHRQRVGGFRPAFRQPYNHSLHHWRPWSTRWNCLPELFDDHYTLLLTQEHCQDLQNQLANLSFTTPLSANVAHRSSSNNHGGSNGNRGRGLNNRGGRTNSNGGHGSSEFTSTTQLPTISNSKVKRNTPHISFLAQASSMPYKSHDWDSTFATIAYIINRLPTPTLYIF
ncbi:hypothetical protein H6P81_018673 [Aristolochia fimbriata]|uniref:Uncharacterized protein n=1 Tax=Aristolochia fimbriata TaxID=158543 RepID=A0AAV7E1Z6_ARIFI|nr:hypothetical protein H6P81_018673 [Aristolochia fimbriata]